jgi:hypothetical protein
MDRVMEDVPIGHPNIYYELRSLMPCAITPGALTSLQGKCKCYNFRCMQSSSAAIELQCSGLLLKACPRYSMASEFSSPTKGVLSRPG